MYWTSLSKVIDIGKENILPQKTEFVSFQVWSWYISLTNSLHFAAVRTQNNDLKVEKLKENIVIWILDS